jgi:TldD protein
VNIVKLKDELASIVKYIEKKLPYASAFASIEKGRIVNASQTSLDASASKTVAGVTITGFTGRYFIEECTSVISSANLRQMADAIIARGLKDMNSPGYSEDVFTIDPGDKLIQDFEIKAEIDASSLPLDCFMKEAKIRRDQIPQITKYATNCGCRLATLIRESLFVNRNRMLCQKIPLLESGWYAVLGKDGETLLASDGACLQGGFETIAQSFSSQREVLEKYEKILGAPRLPDPGIHKCVISPGVAGLLAHEAFGHGTETDMYLKRRSKGGDYLNKRVGANGVFMFDSQKLKGYPGSYFFDDEGVLAQETVIIDDGILVNGLTDLNSATQLSLKRTPNGRRESYQNKVYSRMSNTYFGAGTNTVEEMVSAIDKGYLIELPSNGMEDPKGWGVQCEMMLAREILNGKLTENYFTPVIMTGYVPDILNSITMAGKDLEFFSSGLCGKGRFKELVRVSDGGPWLSLTARIA